MFEAGYTIEAINDALACKANAKLNDLSNSMLSFESRVSGSESIEESVLSDQQNISMSDSATENAVDKLKEIKM